MALPSNTEKHSGEQRQGDKKLNIVPHVSLIGTGNKFHIKIPKRGKSGCPLCPFTKFKPTRREDKLNQHLATHNHGIYLKELKLNVFACHLGCRKAKKDRHAHYHCPCGRTIARKADFHIHWKTCSKNIIKAPPKTLDISSADGRTIKSTNAHMETGSTEREIECKASQEETNQTDTSTTSFTVTNVDRFAANESTHIQIHNLSKGLAEAEHGNKRDGILPEAVQPTTVEPQENPGVDMSTYTGGKTMMDYHDGQSAQEDNKVEEGVFYEFKSTGPKKGTKQTMDGYNDNFAGISDQKQEDCMDQTDFEKLHNHKVFSGCNQAEYGTEDYPMDGISNFKIDEDMDVTEICNYALKDDSSNSIFKYFKEYDSEEHGNCEGDGLGFKQMDT